MISLSFYIWRWQNKYFSINLERKKGTSWTLLNDTNTWCKQVAHRYLQNNIWNFKTSISPWIRLQWASLFWAFFLGMVNIFILQKISPHRDRIQLFCTFAVILDKFSALTSIIFFLCKIWVITNSNRQQISLGGFIEWETTVYFCPFFVHFKPLLDTFPVVQ